MALLTLTPDPRARRWDRTTATLWSGGRGPADTVVLITGAPLLAPAGPRPTARGLQDHLQVDPAALIAVGPRELAPPGSDGLRAYREIVRCGLRVISDPVMRSREGLPTLRRMLAVRPPGSMAVVVDLEGEPPSGPRSEALCGLCRAIGAAWIREPPPVVTIDVVGRPAGDETTVQRFLDKLFAGLLGAEAVQVGIL